jgi:hypothetical protein
MTEGYVLFQIRGPNVSCGRKFDMYLYSFRKMAKLLTKVFFAFLPFLILACGLFDSGTDYFQYAAHSGPYFYQTACSIN